MFSFLAAVVALVGVNVVPMDSDRVLSAQTVIVRDGAIAEIGSVEDVVIPEEAEVVYGRGRYLVPGLIDMHVHIRPADLPRYLENGITTVRDLAGTDSVVLTKRRVENGEVRGPRIFMSSELFTGPDPQNPAFSHPVTSPAAAAGAIDQHLARGADSVKLYEGLSRATYDALVGAARERGLRIAGHVTQHVDVRYAMTMQDSIEHLSGYPVQQASLHRELAVAAREAGVWNCPTLAVFTQRVTVNMPPAEREQLLEARRSFVTALYENGARILAGTDGGWLLPAGVALHDELDELVAAGLSRFDALSAATRSGGEYLGQPIGTIATGNRADLLLVASNPLEDLRVLRRPDAVMLHGEWVYAQGRRRAVRH